MHVTLDQLAARPGAPEAAAAWAASGAGPGWLRSAAAAQGYACDARIQPVVTGHIDPAVLAALTTQIRQMTTRPATQPATQPPPWAQRPPETQRPSETQRPPWVQQPFKPQQPPGPKQPPGPESGGALAADQILRWAVDLLSGPAGLAAALRTAATGPLEDGSLARGVSLPLDLGAATATIPPHLRRAVTVRDRHCAFPGCHRPPSHCQIHHVIPRS